MRRISTRITGDSKKLVKECESEIKHLKSWDVSLQESQVTLKS